MTTPEIVRMLRQRKGYKQEHLADAIGISQSYYSKLESGKKEFKAGHIERLAAFLDAPPPRTEKRQHYALGKATHPEWPGRKSGAPIGRAYRIEKGKQFAENPARTIGKRGGGVIGAAHKSQIGPPLISAMPARSFSAFFWFPKIPYPCPSSRWPHA